MSFWMKYGQNQSFRNVSTLIFYRDFVEDRIIARSGKKKSHNEFPLVK
jgi:hypothetical protein